jgi:hypothetical protein
VNDEPLTPEEQSRRDLLLQAQASGQLARAWAERAARGIPDPVVVVAQRADPYGARFIPRDYIAPVFVGLASSAAIADAVAEWDPDVDSIRTLDTTRINVVVLAEGGMLASRTRDAFTVGPLAGQPSRGGANDVTPTAIEDGAG